MEPERNELDPRELDALQRAQEELSQIDDESPSPDVVAEMPELPDAAEQPGLAAPEIGDLELDGVQRSLLAEDIPDISAPKPGKQNAWWQNLLGMFGRGATQQDAKVPADEIQPRQQPAQPVAPNLKELFEAAQQLNAIDKDGNVDFPRMFEGDQGNVEGQEGPEQQDAKSAEQAVAQQNVACHAMHAEIAHLHSMGLARVHSRLVEIRNGLIRRKQ